jgi:hypothetical protein
MAKPRVNCFAFHCELKVGSLLEYNRLILKFFMPYTIRACTNKTFPYLLTQNIKLSLASVLISVCHDRGTVLTIRSEFHQHISVLSESKHGMDCHDLHIVHSLYPLCAKITQKLSRVYVYLSLNK